MKYRKSNFSQSSLPFTTLPEIFILDTFFSLYFIIPCLESVCQPSYIWNMHITRFLWCLILSLIIISLIQILWKSYRWVSTKDDFELDDAFPAFFSQNFPALLWLYFWIRFLNPNTISLLICQYSEHSLHHFDPETFECLNK